MKTVDVESWASRAQPGERVVYCIWDTRLQMEMEHREALISAMKAHDRGLVFLAQRRCHGRLIQYEATRISTATAVRLRVSTHEQERRAS